MVLRRLCRTPDGQEHDPPPEIAEVYEWTRRYNSRYTHCDLTLEAHPLGVGDRIEFAALGFRTASRGGDKSVTLRQTPGGPLIADAYRDLWKPFFTGEVTVEQAKTMMRWALVNDRTQRRCPIP